MGFIMQSDGSLLHDGLLYHKLVAIRGQYGIYYNEWQPVYIWDAENRIKEKEVILGGNHEEREA